MTTDTLELPEWPAPKLYPPGTYPDGVLTYSADQMRAYALQYGELVRETCAKICDAIYAKEQMEPECYGFARECASAIRNKE